MKRKLLLLNVAALSPAMVAAHAPNLQRLAATGHIRPMRPPFPSLTCPSHATMLTGALPAQHGVVGNGWYEREHAKIMMWNRSFHLVDAEPIWESARKLAPDTRCANLFWRFGADSSCDIVCTERPVYWASGRKSFDFYTSPPTLHDELLTHCGKFPFPQFWGPMAGIKSTEWIMHAAQQIMQQQDPELLLVYAPYLDYDGERHGLDTPEGAAAVAKFDSAVEPLLQAARADERDIAIVSDYGYTPVQTPVFLNQVLRREGLLDVEEAVNGDRLQTGTSRAFAICDNQVAHIYVANPQDLDKVRTIIAAVPGVDQVMGSEEKRAAGIDHPRAGELIAVASPGHWFSYPYWFAAERAPDFAQCIAIFDKIGWDPTELHFRPGVGGKLRMAVRTLQKMARLAVPYDVISGDQSLVCSTRNVRYDDPQQGPLLLTSWAQSPEADVLPMQDLKTLLLERLFASQ